MIKEEQFGVKPNLPTSGLLFVRQIINSYFDVAFEKRVFKYSCFSFEGLIYYQSGYEKFFKN